VSKLPQFKVLSEIPLLLKLARPVCLLHWYKVGPYLFDMGVNKVDSKARKVSVKGKTLRSYFTSQAESKQQSENLETLTKESIKESSSQHKTSKVTDLIL
jgi:hypothetical protein